ncbi:MAG: 4-(cytidine 5'-diphospho)-2-C-methyl-D-erythritol kinase [Erysipelotrichaceae bacterium]|jgi:4-diphosphocytidyl-2-C-methyl-D-erythritol kinase|nr:4-(cytidine 5'-diphospho)-2-C-methyl-D-erythritol kinase [Erysipelotrichaceae bacterium]
MKAKAYAKINLSLDVVGKRTDGLHELAMIMAPIDLYDELEITLSKKPRFFINQPFIANKTNTVMVALELLRKKYGFKENFTVRIKKHIPTQAGLGGGSSDAALAIRMADALLGLNMSFEEMCEIGVEVGADVPFCLYGKPAIVHGIGEQIEPLTLEGDWPLLIVKPRRGVSTRKAFALSDELEGFHPDIQQLQEYLKNNQREQFYKHMGNCLQVPAEKLVKVIAVIRNKLLEAGFCGALLSGSGSAVIGFADTFERCEKNRRFFGRYGFSCPAKILKDASLSEIFGK